MNCKNIGYRVISSFHHHTHHHQIQVTGAGKGGVKIRIITRYNCLLAFGFSWVLVDLAGEESLFYPLFGGFATKHFFVYDHRLLFLTLFLALFSYHSIAILGYSGRWFKNHVILFHISIVCFYYVLAPWSASFCQLRSVLYTPNFSLEAIEEALSIVSSCLESIMGSWYQVYTLGLNVLWKFGNMKKI